MGHKKDNGRPRPLTVNVLSDEVSDKDKQSCATTIDYFMLLACMSLLHPDASCLLVMISHVHSDHPSDHLPCVCFVWAYQKTSRRLP